jgi:hypothetical protein
MSKDKSAIAIALILMATIAVTLVALPQANAHDPTWEIPTWTYIGVSPETVGVNQEVVLAFWQNLVPPTANGAYGDRWFFHVEVTKPDGTKETLGTGEGFISDPVGGSFTTYTPTQVGTYIFVAKFPGHVLNNYPNGMAPSGLYAGSAMSEASNVTEFLGDYFLPSESEPVTLTVTEDPVPKYVETPLPIDYWTRPIYGANRFWYEIAANWLGSSSGAHNVGPTSNFNYGEAPETSHILWSKVYWAGGIMDERFGPVTYHTTHYEGLRFSPPLIIQGKLFYSVSWLPKEGWYCVDLYTGETEYFHNTTGEFVRQTLNVRNEVNSFDSSGGLLYGNPSFGQIYDYESPNQHGGFPYLWVTSTGKTNTWDMLDAMTGNLICSIANVSSGTSVYGKDGSILRYAIRDLQAGPGVSNYLQVWNTSDVIMNRWNYSAIGGNSYWMWRPYFNYTFDGNNGFSLNVSIPTLPGGMLAVREGEFIIGGTSGFNDGSDVTKGNLWALSLAEGDEGKLLWNREFTPPAEVPQEALQDLQFSRHDMSGPAVDPEDGVFLFEQTMTRERWVYSLDTMQQLWKSDPEPQFNFYGLSDTIYQGKLFSYGYSGVLIAYNITTGNILWNWSAPSVGYLETPYTHTPLSVGLVGDGKLYLYSSEHSPNTPLRRDCKIYCVDTETGKMLWSLTSYPGGMALADGRIVELDYFDNSIYCIGRGPTATTVSAPQLIPDVGSSVMITGTVTDQSPGAPGTPAMADESMDEWMEYLYHERPMPEDAKGVEVVLETLDPNGNFYEIGNVTTDTSGNYGLMWEPPVPGTYQIMARFPGSGAYGPSRATTYLGVTEAPQATPTPPPPEPSMTDVYFLPATIGILVAIVVVGLVLALLLRKR